MSVAVRHAALLLAALLAAAPAFAQSEVLSPESGAQMRAANQQAGYTDGCATARSSRIAPEMQRDEAAFSASESYRGGWRAGYNECKPSMDSTSERLLGDPFGRRW